MKQADEYARAINFAIVEVANNHDKPELNAILGAIAGETGKKLAYVTDTKLRKSMYNLVIDEIKKQMNNPQNKPEIPAELCRVEDLRK